MRVEFKSTSIPKRAAKLISKATQRPLNACHEATARATGYRDWHDLASTKSTALGPQLREEQAVSVAVEIIESLSRSLSANAGDILCAIAKSKIIPSTEFSSRMAIEVRRRLFERGELPRKGRRQQGAIGKAKTAGWMNNQPVILRRFGKATRVISHKSANSYLADFEYVSPRKELSLFIPMRLYIPYGEWIEPDGATVLFSRDYKPLWRLRADSAPERLEPSLWINFTKQHWFWDDTNTPWRVPETYSSVMNMLDKLGAIGTPRLVEVLPIVVFKDDVSGFSEAVDHLAKE